MTRQTAPFGTQEHLSKHRREHNSIEHLARTFSSCLLAILIFSSCTATLDRPRKEPAPVENIQTQAPVETQAQIPGQQEVLQAQAMQARKVELSFSARVKRLLPDDTKGLPHQLFLVELENGTTVKVAHDTKYAEKVPIQEGDLVTIKGEYIWNRLGGVIHWTHHSDTPRHEGGFIDFAGKRYE